MTINDDILKKNETLGNAILAVIREEGKINSELLIEQLMSMERSTKNASKQKILSQLISEVQCVTGVHSEIDIDSSFFLILPSYSRKIH
ncbi:hypothetical protein [Cronobacter sakazakii]|uniref:hypothetical protein n=1 Tax=Cronobacter sakazakii TaxID=28141 RepID=UPI0015C527F3|nr:hypothetical protein [Cronobacter sakazakii]EMA8632495.1 hypothetical protein [Cronobacter sakazakii]